MPSKKWALLLLLPLLIAAVPNVEGIISTVIGTTPLDNVPALGHAIGYPIAIASDNVGNLYFSDNQNSVIRRIDGGSGIETIIAGTGLQGFSGDGSLALNARLNHPWGIAYVLDNANSAEWLYFSDSGNQRIRRIDLKQGTIETIAGNGSKGFSGDGGPASLASFSSPQGVYADINGRVLVADSGNNRIRSFVVGVGNISTVAGSGAAEPSPTSSANIKDGFAPTVGILNSPGAVVAQADGSFYIADSNHYRVRYVDAAGTKITTVAGTLSTGYNGDNGGALGINLSRISSLALNSAGKLFIGDWDELRVRRFDPLTGQLSTYAGSGVPSVIGYGNSGDGGLATAGVFSYIQSMAFNANGDLFFTDYPYSLLRKVDAATQHVNIIGGSNYTGAGTGPGDQVAISDPRGIVSLPNGDVLVVNAGANKLMRWQATDGQVVVFAGNGNVPVSPTAKGDGGPAINAEFGGLDAIARDAAGNIYLTDYDPDFDIRKIDANGIITTICGLDGEGSTNDGGAASAAGLDFMGGIAAHNNKVYVADQSGSYVRVINTSLDTIGAYASVSSNPTGYQDGPVATALFDHILGMAVDSQGALYMADSANNAVRRVDPAGLSVTTVCGLGPLQPGYRGDGGLAVSAALNAPAAVWFDAQDNLFISDSANSRIRRVDRVTGIIETVAGDGYVGFSGDGGPAKLARLYAPGYGCTDASGTILFSDALNNRVRKIGYFQTPTPTPVVSASNKVLAYPSPADKRVCFAYAAPKAGKVKIEVYNVAMSLVAKMEEDAPGSGPAVTCGDVSRLASGIYLYRLSIDGAYLPTNKFKVAH